MLRSKLKITARRTMKISSGFFYALPGFSFQSLSNFLGRAFLFLGQKLNNLTDAALININQSLKNKTGNRTEGHTTSHLRGVIGFMDIGTRQGIASTRG
jgi:hypothetical protein